MKIDAGRDRTTVTLTDGTLISLDNFSEDGMYGTVDIAPGTITPLDAFSYSLSQQVSGSHRPATRADTSLPRPGNVGLPIGYEFIVTRITVDIEAPDRVLQSNALKAWLSTTAFRFLYRNKQYVCKPLSMVATGRGVNMETIPIRLQENLMFSAVIEPMNRLCVDALAITQRHAGAVLKVRVNLHGLSKIPVY
jgi:hypothetical protein